MDAMKCLLERRSCRSYQKKQISDAELDAILEAGTYAATAKGSQPAKLVVVQKPEDVATLERMNAAVLGNPDGKPFYGAPTVVLVLADAHAMCPVEDGSLVLGNLMNAAHALGIGSCWINRAKEMFASDEGKTLLKKWGIDGDWIGVGHCILGYVEGDLPAPKPRKADYIVKI